MAGRLTVLIPPMRSFVTNFLRIIVGIFIIEPHIKRTNAKILLLQQQQKCRCQHDYDDHDHTSPVLY